MNPSIPFEPTIEEIPSKSLQTKHFPPILEDLKHQDDVHRLTTSSPSIDHQGIPSPKDSILEISGLENSLSSSVCDPPIEVDEFLDANRISLIQKANRDLKLAVENSIKFFHSTSDLLLNHSVSNSNRTSVLMSELQDMKNELREYSEQSRMLLERSDADVFDEEEQEAQAIQDAYREMNEAQQRINLALQKIQESKEMIDNAEVNNNGLKIKIDTLEKAITETLFTEENVNEPACTCSLQ